MTMDAAELLALDRIAIRDGERLAFRGTRWTWRRGEQWAILGPNGSGKSLLALALCGKAPVVRGEIRHGFAADAAPDKDAVLLSPHAQREMILRESSFYQSRWHSGLGEGQRTVAQFLSQASVEEINPFEVGARRGDTREFRRRRQRFVRWLGVAPMKLTVPPEVGVVAESAPAASKVNVPEAMSVCTPGVPPEISEPLASAW